MNSLADLLDAIARIEWRQTVQLWMSAAAILLLIIAILYLRTINKKV